ncbi:MAG: SpoVR family protein [Parvularculaceae bacterium]
MARAVARAEHEQQTFNDIWRPCRTPKNRTKMRKSGIWKSVTSSCRKKIFFILSKKRLPKLRPWQRELVRIVRNISQYFYPQKQTKVMNEGCATFVHHYIMNELYNRGRISEGAIMEFLHSHSSVVFQPDFDDRRYSGINPYALGFAMMEDIKRISENPTGEDRDWFPGIAGAGDWRDVLKDAWANYRDESFILQFLSPTVMRNMRMFALHDDEQEGHVEIAAIHDDYGFRKVRETLASSYDLGRQEPNIQVTNADLDGSRRLTLKHSTLNGRALDKKTLEDTVWHIHKLWGHEVKLDEDAA